MTQATDISAELWEQLVDAGWTPPPDLWLPVAVSGARAAQAYELRQTGMSYAQIGRNMGDARDPSRPICGTQARYLVRKRERYLQVTGDPPRRGRKPNAGHVLTLTLEPLPLDPGWERESEG